jgi:hypothetical protein
LAAIVSNLLCHCDIDFNGPSFASIVFVVALFLLVVTLIFMFLVAAIGNPFGCGFGCGYWQSFWLWSWLWLLAILLVVMVVVLVVTIGNLLVCGFDYSC